MREHFGSLMLVLSLVSVPGVLEAQVASPELGLTATELEDLACFVASNPRSADSDSTLLVIDNEPAGYLPRPAPDCTATRPPTRVARVELIQGSTAARTWGEPARFGAVRVGLREPEQDPR